MKKQLLLCAIALGCVAFHACKKDDNNGNELVGPVTLTAPANDAEINLGEVDDVIFEWKGSAAGYLLQLSNNPDMLAKVSYPATGTSYTVTAQTLEDRLAAAKIEPGKKGKIYWTVRPADDDEANTPVFSLNVTRRPVPADLIGPSDKYNRELDYTSPEGTAAVFSWEPPKGATCTLVISKNEDLSEPFVESAEESAATFTNEEMQSWINNTGLKLKKYKKNTLYWNVKVNGALNKSYTRSFTISGYKTFTYPGSGNTYTVSVIQTGAGQAVWLSTNLNETVDILGTPLNSRLYYDFSEEADFPTELKPFVGKHYNNSDLTELKSLIVPPKWRIPTFFDFSDLYIAAIDAYGGYHNGVAGSDVLKLKEAYEYPAQYRLGPQPQDGATPYPYIGKPAPHFNAWNMNMAHYGRGVWQGGLDNKALVVKAPEDLSPDEIALSWCYMFDYRAVDSPPLPLNEKGEEIPIALMFSWASWAGGYSGAFDMHPENRGAIPVRLLYAGDGGDE
jgi:hypothetical protein